MTWAYFLSTVWAKICQETNAQGHQGVLHELADALCKRGGWKANPPARNCLSRELYVVVLPHFNVPQQASRPQSKREKNLPAFIALQIIQERTMFAQSSPIWDFKKSSVDPGLTIPTKTATGIHKGAEGSSSSSTSCFNRITWKGRSSTRERKRSVAETRDANSLAPLAQSLDEKLASLTSTLDYIDRSGSFRHEN